MRDALADNEIIKQRRPWQDYYTADFVPKLNDFDENSVLQKARAAG